MRYLICLILTLGCQDAPKPEPELPPKPSAGQELPASSVKKVQYAFDAPDKVYTMPAKLTEISGITLLRENELLSVEDERGRVYVYNTAEEAITETIQFEKKGDFEDIAVYNDTIYVLRSNGALFQMAGEEVTEIDLGLKKKDDLEGLYADTKNRRLLIASKAKSAVYAFDLQKEETAKLWTLEEENFAPSALAIHPIIHDIYMISTVSRELLVLSQDGKIKERHALPRKVFKQPEGIAFAPNGDLYISNEGRDGKGNILFFRQKN